ncbi:hypothetical protein Pcac1_g12573 [Phytophthora cactorum]|nr:hypothetical protein Pcac1_g12573 [Phytophthora cactorum]KAG2839897.1 hypothetical protein PC111_g3703 [Phytophthora cactorum]KAG3100037.1 hypothetical protein PC122_g3299 [Phytophthora cactorum]
MYATRFTNSSLTGVKYDISYDSSRCGPNVASPDDNDFVVDVDYGDEPVELAPVVVACGSPVVVSASTVVAGSASTVVAGAPTIGEANRSGDYKLLDYIMTEELSLKETEDRILSYMDTVHTRAWGVYYDFSNEALAKKLAQLKNRGADVGSYFAQG